MLPHERRTRLERTPRLHDSGPHLQLALLHVRLPRVALPVRTGPALRRRTKIRARDAQIPLPDCARLLQRRLQVIFRTAPILVASSATRRAVAIRWRQNFDRAKKTQFSASSHIWSLPLPTCGHRTRGQSCVKPRSIIMLLSKLTCPSHATWPLVRLPISLLCQIQVIH